MRPHVNSVVNLGVRCAIRSRGVGGAVGQGLQVVGAGCFGTPEARANVKSVNSVLEFTTVRRRAWYTLLDAPVLILDVTFWLRSGLDCRVCAIFWPSTGGDRRRGFRTSRSCFRRPGLSRARFLKPARRLSSGFAEIPACIYSILKPGPDKPQKLAYTLDPRSWAKP